jgi:hypothetical protein
MAEILALEKLYTDIKARFTAEGNAALADATTFGWREPPKQGGAITRIQFVPGNPNSDLGEVGPARYPGRNPRPLGNLHELVTVYLTAADQTDLTNELLQYKATRLLFDTWFRAVYLAAHGTFEIKSAEWLVDKKQRGYGASIRVVMTIDAMIPDSIDSYAPVDTEAHITTTELDVSDPVVVVLPVP